MRELDGYAMALSQLIGQRYPMNGEGSLDIQPTGLGLAGPMTSSDVMTLVG